MAKKEKKYVGYFLMDTGIKVPFDVSEENGGKNFSLHLYGNCEFPWEKGDSIWLGEKNPCFILADRIIGFEVDEYDL